LSWPSKNVEISGKFEDWSQADASRRWGLELETITACRIDKHKLENGCESDAQNKNNVNPQIGMG
jgi:hypothetical protein